MVHTYLKRKKKSNFTAFAKASCFQSSFIFQPFAVAEIIATANSAGLMIKLKKKKKESSGTRNMDETDEKKQLNILCFF